VRILLTNDDGVFAPGIVALGNILFPEEYDLVVCAPDRERSSVGHAITLTRPLRLWPVDAGPYEFSSGIYACEREIVISGINRGPNLGDDLTYSGTVSAAMEGSLLGLPAVAVSLAINVDDKEHYYETAAIIVRDLLKKKPFSFQDLTKGVLLNINVPNVPLQDLKGIKITRKGVRFYEDKIHRLKDPKGNSYYWIAGKPEDDLVEGTDVWAVAHNYVSITPVHMDLTHYPSLEQIRDLLEA
jgi:5'-nucleotidase